MLEKVRTKMKKLLILCALIASPALAAETNYVSVTPTVDTSAYAAKDNIGGLQTLSLIGCNNKRRGKITSVVLTDKSDNATEYDIITFSSIPVGTFTDQAAVDPSDSDLLRMNPVINIASTDHFSFNDNGISSLSGLKSNGIAYVTSSLPGTLYAAIVSRGTPTYGSSSDLTLTIGFECD